MTTNIYKTYCYLVALKNTLEEGHLRKEERNVLEEIVMETLQLYPADYAFKSMRVWFEEYQKLKMYKGAKK